MLSGREKEGLREKSLQEARTYLKNNLCPFSVYSGCKKLIFRQNSKTIFPQSLLFSLKISSKLTLSYF